MDLNLPSYPMQMRRGPRGRVEIHDRLRGRWVALTPEEWVRQHFVEWLVQAHGYPAARMANEVSLTLNATRRRCDTVVYDGARRPWAVIEYKAPDVELTPRVLAQAARYNLVLNAPVVMVSNGMRHHCLVGGAFTESIPPYPMPGSQAAATHP